jgi:transcriptional regulator with XRE-family HTH domain
MFYIKIGKNVKKYREDKKFTQLELAYAMNYKSVSLISAAELYNTQTYQESKQEFDRRYKYIP